MNILVTGANGQLAKCLQEIVHEKGNGHPDSYVGEKDYWIFADRETLDITKLDDVVDYVRKNYINVIVNCAAYTNVAKAEDDTYNAYAVNVAGAEILAYACSKNGAVLIHISTDYVFDGKSEIPYTPDSQTNPLNAYGKTKLDGEILVKKQPCKSLIFRTSWLYSRYGKNFVKTMFNKGYILNENANVVDDQVGCPTNANDLARFIYRIVTENNAENRYLSKDGIYHYCNSGKASWYDFAKEIYKLSGSNSEVYPIKTTDSPVNRPQYSVMDTSLTTEIFNEEFKSWRESLKEVVEQLITE